MKQPYKIIGHYELVYFESKRFKKIKITDHATMDYGIRYCENEEEALKLFTEYTDKGIFFEAILCYYESFNYLKEHMCADDFIQFCKDRLFDPKTVGEQ